MLFKNKKTSKSNSASNLSNIYVWKIPNGMYAAARNNIIELMIAPLTPLFETLGIGMVNKSYRRIWKKYFKTFDIIPKNLIFTLNKYAYYNGSLSLKQMALMFYKIPAILKMMFTNPIPRWQNTDKPAYEKLAREQEKLKPEDLKSEEIVEKVKVLTKSAVDSYGSIVSGIIPGAWITEGLFTLIYNLFIKRKKDPKAAVLLMGYNTQPIRAEKALFDLSCWIKAESQLADFFLNTPAQEIRTMFTYSIKPKKVKEKLWNQWIKKFNDFLGEFGHFIYSLDFSNSTPKDNPTDLLQTCKMYVKGEGNNPHQRQKQLEKQRVLAVEKIRRRLKGLRLKLFNKTVALAQKFAPARENGLSDVGLVYPAIRSLLKELGSRMVTEDLIDEPTDIYWIYEQELCNIALGLDKSKKLRDFKTQVLKRKKDLEHVEKFSPPKMLVWGITKKDVIKKELKKASIINGVAGSQGVVTAKAVIINSPADFSKMKQGSILVAPLTTPAWLSLFPRAAAIVTDIGGALSHGSIVAREYNIPAVLGTKNATKVIADGQQITVDGTKGKIVLH